MVHMLDICVQTEREREITKKRETEGGREKSKEDRYSHQNLRGTYLAITYIIIPVITTYTTAVITIIITIIIIIIITLTLPSDILLPFPLTPSPSHSHKKSLR